MYQAHRTHAGLLDTSSSADVVVVGAGIHSLIYAIHARKHSNESTRITVLERAPQPSYKIGESTLTVFGLWLKTIGIDAPILWRLFGPKDGLAFYYLERDGDPERYTNFCANGPPGDFVPTLQIERTVSELLLTLIAQRMGVDVWHGHDVAIDATALKAGESVVHVTEKATSAQKKIHSQLVVDATGRFRRFASKEARLKRIEGWNTDAFWAYFDMPGDESQIPLKYYESCNTNHICLAEGWAWIIRLPSWEGSPIPNLTRMINYLLDLNAAKTPADQIPSSHELVKMFGLKFRWVVSIGFALRTDVVYPTDLTKYGSTEGERRFNWIVSRYPKLQAIMSQHILISKLYNDTTWFIRKNLSYVSPRVHGDGWVAIGDAVGFTNPLYSPGINVNMGTSVAAAELTSSYIKASTPQEREEVMERYEGFCRGRIEALHRMNELNYSLMRSPRLGPLGPLWQYLAGTGNANWQRMRSFDFSNVSEILMHWNWGAQEIEYVAFANKVLPSLQGRPDEPISTEVEDMILQLSELEVQKALQTGKYKNRWAGLLRWYDDDLRLNANKPDRDVLAKRCGMCGNWRILHGAAKFAVSTRVEVLKPLFVRISQRD
ncbi:hypothetical protein BDQ12DRAFT_759546 [Crucibulum laeve]|uniref:FAD/NAD(P)-binding domain-containing protein n=1 Tax=Crucibulum laeve TaxID=68775 RepID=A0A5C3LS45_9AGAR|nr:hypothetical protein BDQ12DRAFT_759546 [Crucibulum laeve]